jgi:putative spermidine/putrescine transport system permease protein
VDTVEERVKRLVRRFFTTLLGSLIILIPFICYVVPFAFWVSRRRDIDPTYSWELFFVLLPPTVSLSFASSLIATAVGTATACLFILYGRPVRILISIFMTIPLLMGFLARNYSWLGLLSFFDFLPLMYSRIGIVLVMGSVFVPYAYFIVLPSLQPLTPESLEAALTMGVPSQRLFSSIVLPLARRGILLSIALTTVLGMGYFVTPRMIGGGNYDFLGNGILRLRDLGQIEGADLLALYMTLALLFVVVPVIILSVRQRRILIGR